jgi:hypothetical protein
MAGIKTLQVCKPIPAKQFLTPLQAYARLRAIFCGDLQTNSRNPHDKPHDSR